MKWSDIAQTIGKVAPTIGGLLGGNLGASVGGLISEALGVDNTPEAVITALNKNPDSLLKLKELESSERIKLKELDKEERKDEFLFEENTTEVVNETMREEGKSEHWVQYTWRPFIGFCVGISLLGGVVIAIAAYVGLLLGKPEGMATLPAILGALAGINTTALPILGIASYFRGKEKLGKG